MSKILNNKFIVGAVVLLSLVLLLYFLYFGSLAPEGEVFNVVLDAGGFKPDNLTISKNDTVIFTTTGDKPFWPASDLHPTHGIYPEFDPRQPIEPGKSWSFKFNKKGTWKYHDHLFSINRGIVNVVDKDSFGSGLINCKNQTECWEAKITDALDKKGLDVAFEILADLYTKEPAFAPQCHDQAHKLGEVAYDKFAKRKSLNLTPKTSYCGYGFYHGFMETLLQSGGNIEQARNFCAYAGKTLMVQTSDAEGACYHGIGHGAVDGSDPTAWGNPQKMIEPGLKLCEMIAEPIATVGTHFYRCITGAYNSIEILSANPKYKLAMMMEDPFWLCPSQPESYKEGCYTNMLPALMRFSGNDFIKAARAIERVKEINDSYSIRSMVIAGLFHDFININLNQPNYSISEGIKLCRSLDQRLTLPCVEGLAGGHMKYGEPQKEYIRGLAFCGSDLLHEDEKNVCYQHILSRLRIWYSQEKTNEICSGVDKKYSSKYCLF